MKARWKVSLASLALLAVSWGRAADVPDKTGSILRLEFKGAVDPPVSAYLRAGIARAQNGGSQAVLVVMDTPGGLLDSTREIVQAMVNCPLPVIVYASPRGARATSAGLFLMMAADVAAMAPGTHLGAAHPVPLGGPPAPGGGGDKPEGRRGRAPPGGAMEEKAVSDAAAYIRALAAERGRDARWAEKAVRESVSLTAREALARGVIELVAEDEPRLLERLHGRRVTKLGRTSVLRTRGALVEKAPMTPFERALHILANPNLAYLLLMIGLYGLIYEFSSPGVGFGAVVGLVSLALAGYSMSILPVSYAGLAIVALGVVLLALETQVASHGLLALGGLALLALGSLFLFDSPEPLWRVSRPLIVGTLLGAAAFVLGVVAKVVQARRLRPALGPEALVGRVGEVRQDLAPIGLVFLDGELWSATADAPVLAGARVVVREARGSMLKVEPLKEA